MLVNYSQNLNCSKVICHAEQNGASRFLTNARNDKPIKNVLCLMSGVCIELFIAPIKAFGTELVGIELAKNIINFIGFLKVFFWHGN